jgi:serine/threonine protein phosphatase PrpC
MNYATALDVGKQKRQAGRINEDSVAVNLLEDGHRNHHRSAGVFVLADGAGGSEAGDVASYVTTVEVTRRITAQVWADRQFADVVDASDAGRAGGPELDPGALQPPLAAMPDGTVQGYLEEAIQAAHTRLLEVIGDLGLEEAYSTVVAALVVGDRLHYAWVGDSRAYVVNVGGDRPLEDRVTLLTRDHSEVQRLLQEGLIDEVEAQVHQHGNRITRALGGPPSEDASTSSVAVDSASVPLFGDDVVLLASDGLTDAFAGASRLHREYLEATDRESVSERIREASVTTADIRDVVLGEATLEAAADRFVRLANERGGKDNVSLVLFRDPTLDPREGPLPRRAPDPDTDEVASLETAIEDADGPPDDGYEGPSDGGPDERTQ